MLFRVLFGVDVIAALVAVYFFLWGVIDGTVSSFNFGLWMALLAGVVAVPGAAWALRARGRVWAANLLLGVMAVPALFAGVLILILIFDPPHWN